MLRRRPEFNAVPYDLELHEEVINIDDWWVTGLYWQYSHPGEPLSLYNVDASGVR